MAKAKINGFIARSLVFNELNFFYLKPNKAKERGVWVDTKGSIGDLIIPKGRFPEITWEDEEPTPAELTIKVVE